MNIRLISIDVAKNVFQVCALGRSGKPLLNKRVPRSRLVTTVLQLDAKLVVMEACYSAHYWGRYFQGLGFQVHLIPPQHVKPFVRGNKNDANDALAIAEAALRPDIRFVPVKTIEQQDIQMLHRIRQRRVDKRTALVNQIRGLLSDYGVVVRIGWRALKAQLPAIVDDQSNDLSQVARRCFSQLYSELEDVNLRIEEIENELLQLVGSRDDYQRLLQIPGIGRLTASALISAIGNGSQFKNARQMAAWIGLTPRQEGSGDRLVMYGISKRGDRYLRTLLIHCARTVVNWSHRKDDPLNAWVNRLVARRGKQKATVALAHKLARFSWVLLNRQEDYRPSVRVSN